MDAGPQAVLGPGPEPAVVGGSAIGRCRVDLFWVTPALAPAVVDHNRHPGPSPTTPCSGRIGPARVGVEAALPEFVRATGLRPARAMPVPVRCGPPERDAPVPALIRPTPLVLGPGRGPGTASHNCCPGTRTAPACDESGRPQLSGAGETGGARRLRFAKLLPSQSTDGDRMTRTQQTDPAPSQEELDLKHWQTHDVHAATAGLLHKISRRPALRPHVLGRRRERPGARQREGRRLLGPSARTCPPHQRTGRVAGPRARRSSRNSTLSAGTASSSPGKRRNSSRSATCSSMRASSAPRQ